MAPALTVPLVEDTPLNGLKKSVAETKFEVSENYDGDYRFAPIEEAQVSRAMIKRYVLAIVSIRRIDGLLGVLICQLLQYDVRPRRV